MRDPRYQTQSRLRIPSSFLCEKNHIAGYCRGYEGKCFINSIHFTRNGTLYLSADDFMLSSALPPERYKLVKYENLVSDPKRTMLDLYSFAGVPVTKQMLVSVNQHFNAELFNKKRYTFVYCF